MITVHLRVRNEENFCEAALKSVAPVASKVLIVDTGSEDRTLEILKNVPVEKRIVNVPPADAAGLCEYRNDMAEMTETEWYWIMDGDEVYDPKHLPEITDFLREVPPHIHRVLLHRRHPYHHPGLISGYDTIGRIFRASTVRWKLFEGRGKVGHETAFLKNNPSADLRPHSIMLPRRIFFYHFHYFQRSPAQHVMGKMRGWRKPPFPITPFKRNYPFKLEHGPLPFWRAFALSIYFSAQGFIPWLKKKYNRTLRKRR